MAYTVESVKKLLGIITGEMIAAKDELTAIDSKLGDGDMGASMEKGALALQKSLEGDASDISSLLSQGAVVFNRAAPSTMGTLLSFALQEIAKYCKENPELSAENVVHIPQIAVDIIAKRGKAKEGDKTILDALIPFASALEQTFRETGDLKAALHKASDAAAAGMESTKGMIAKTGRAKWLADRNKECPDGGAVMCTRIALQLVKQFG
ncbi:dihydroxyacetone kinase subunit L [Spirochaetia bacterium]|nr:dihydroxyacetone kinase subunit L [Spirochaetia bacterium]